VVSGIVFGIYSDHLKRRAPLICVSTLCMSLASIAFVVFPSNLATWLWPLGVLFGLGYGAYMSVDRALSIDALPSLEEAGKDLGLWEASATLPAILAPLLGSLIINIGNLYGQTELGYPPGLHGRGFLPHRGSRWHTLREGRKRQANRAIKPRIL
jgi:MFS family permease